MKFSLRGSRVEPPSFRCPSRHSDGVAGGKVDEAVVQLYVDGASGDTAKLKTVSPPRCRRWSWRGGRRRRAGIGANRYFFAGS